MEPFHVICETCHARLKIRSASVIGEVHACPKCESMVHIVPPAGWVMSPESVASGVPTAEPVEVIASDLAVVPATSSILLWAVGGAAIAVVASLAAVMIWSNGEATVVPPATAVADAEPEPAPATPDSPDVVSEAAAIESSTGEAQPVVDATDTPTEPAVELQVVPEASQESVAVDAAADDSPAEFVAAPATVAASESPSPPAEVDERRPVMKFDPLDFDPAQLSLGATNDAPSTSASRSVEEGDLRAMSEVVADAAADEPSVADVEAGDPTVTVRVGPPPTAPPGPRNVSEQLALAVESLDMRGVPLVNLVDMVSDMADVPITVDPMALAMAGVSPQVTIDVAARNTTLERLLRDALAKCRLEFEVREGQVVIVRPNADARRAVDYDVKDLMTPGAHDAAEVAKLIKEFVAADSWHGGADGGTIQVDGPKLRVDRVNRVQIQILMFCERLRLARGLTPRSRYPAERLSVVSPYKKLSPLLEKQATHTFLPWTRLADVVQHWQESSGVTMLVDWTALAKEELAPSTPLACSVVGRPWDEALDAVLEPLGLAWWAVDGETIQITSRSALEQIGQIEFYPVPKGQTNGADMVDGATHVEVDAASGRLIVLGSPEVHRGLGGQPGKSSSPQRRDEHDDLSSNAMPNGKH